MVEENKQSEKEKLSEKLSSLEGNEKIDAIVNFAKTNTLDTIRIVLMIIGLFWLFFDTFYAGILIGIIFGISYSNELTKFLNNLKDFNFREGIGRNAVLVITLIALFYTFPGFFIGSALAIAIKELFTGGSK